MTKQYDNTNKGVLFLNDRKEQDNHPDRKGSINIDGKEYWLSGWDKQTSKGDTISLSAQPKEQQAKGGGQQQRNNTQRSAPPPADNSFEDDDLPF